MSDAPSGGAMPPSLGWQFVTPELPVRDVRAAQRFYRDVLGCRIAWIYEEEYGCVYHGPTELFLSLAEGPFESVTVFVRVADADALLATYRERGARIVQDIASHPWGMREFTVADLDGHRLRIGHSEGPVVSGGSQGSQGATG